MAKSEAADPVESEVEAYVAAYRKRHGKDAQLSTAQLGIVRGAIQRAHERSQPPRGFQPTETRAGQLQAAARAEYARALARSEERAAAARAAAAPAVGEPAASGKSAKS